MKVSLKIKPSSMTAFQQSLMVSMQHTLDAAKIGLDQAADKTLNISQLAVPRVTGALASSAKITRYGNASVLRRTISYGGSNTNPRTGRPTAEYAVKVHEIYNPKNPHSYKWLELAVRGYGQSAFLHELASTIRTAL